MAHMVNPQFFMTQISVTKVLDGDTIEVSDHGQVKSVRLLDVNTPKALDPNKPVECGGPEASIFLKEMLPLGMIVRLRYIHDTQDSYV